MEETSAIKGFYLFTSKIIGTCFIFTFIQVLVKEFTTANDVWGHVATARKRSHQWCLILTPNNTETIERMTCHCFLRPIRRDLMSSSYTTGRTSRDNSIIHFHMTHDTPCPSHPPPAKVPIVSDFLWVLTTMLSKK